MLDIAVCDDDREFLVNMEKLLCDLENEYKIEITIDTFSDGSSLVNSVLTGRCYDIICLDIQMDGIDGLETARQIRAVDQVVELIYVTSYESFMKRVFEVHPCGFIKKPLHKDEFEQTFQRVFKTIMGQDSYYRFRYNKGDYKVLVRDIIYFTRDLRKTYIIEQEGRYTEYRKLSEIGSILSEGKGVFLRIHNSYLVNYRHIVKLAYDHVIMSNEEKLSISSRYRKEVNEQLRWIAEKMPRQG